jgi:hypothetical protein
VRGFRTDAGGWDHGALSRNVARVIREVRVFKERIEIELRVGELAVIRRARPRPQHGQGDARPPRSVFWADPRMVVSSR